MNNGSESAGIDDILVGTSCTSTLDVLIPKAACEKAATEGLVIELNREDLMEFLIRTSPSVSYSLGMEVKEEKS